MACSGLRHHDRVAFYAELRIKDLSSGRVYPARSFDLSRGGVGFYASTFLAVGTPIQVTILLTVEGRDVAVALDAVVKHSAAASKGGIHGGWFCRPLTPSEQPLLCQYLDLAQGQTA